jgi:adenosylcobinamide-GDP ribazoletransferase
VVRLNLLAALQFLTRVPIRLRREPSLPAAAPWFPIAGAIIGIAVGGVAGGLWHWMPATVAATVAVVIGMLITGAFHEDGLADIADAFGGGWTVERRLEILKDPRHGTYGVAALVGSVALRITALGALPGPAVMFAGAVAAHTTGRAAAVGLMLVGPTARHDGLGADYTRLLRRRTAVLGIVAGLAITIAAIGWWAAPVVGIAVVTAAAVLVLARRKIGGISGDVLGACEQVVECATLVTVAALASRHPLWWS